MSQESQSASKTLDRVIVLADDDPVVRHILGAILAAANYEVRSASSGAECLELVQAYLAAGTQPAAFFLDMFLGDMSGLELLREIRSSFTPSAPPVVILSANPKEEALAVDPSIKPDDYLEKPFTGKTVLETLTKLLEQ